MDAAGAALVVQLDLGEVPCHEESPSGQPHGMPPREQARRRRRVTIRRTSSGVKGSFLRLGSSWLNQRSLQLLPLRPLPRLLAMRLQFWGP